MACSLTQSIALACRDSKGGVRRLLIAQLEDKQTLTATSGNVGTFTMDTGKRFWEYQQEIEKASFTQNFQGSRENGTFFVEMDAIAVIFKGDATVSNEIKLLAQNRLMIIIEDQNGVFWLLGATNGMMLEPSTFNSGTAMGDMNGFTLNFKGKEPDPAYTVTSSLIPTLLAPAV